MIMKYLITSMLLVSFICLHGQEQISTGAQKDVRVERTKPGVYITFERVGELKTLDSGD